MGTPNNMAKSDVDDAIDTAITDYNRAMGNWGGNSELLNESTVVPTSSCSLFQVSVVAVRHSTSTAVKVSRSGARDKVWFSETEAMPNTIRHWAQRLRSNFKTLLQITLLPLHLLEILYLLIPSQDRRQERQFPAFSKRQNVTRSWLPFFQEIYLSITYLYVTIVWPRQTSIHGFFGARVFHYTFYLYFKVIVCIVQICSVHTIILVAYCIEFVHY